VPAPDEARAAVADLALIAAAAAVSAATALLMSPRVVPPLALLLLLTLEGTPAPVRGDTLPPSDAAADAPLPLGAVGGAEEIAREAAVEGGGMTARADDALPLPLLSAANPAAAAAEPEAAEARSCPPRPPEPPAVAGAAAPDFGWCRPVPAAGAGACAGVAAATPEELS
jgi:hypothetical protein